MIDQLQLQNFKGFKADSIPLRALTLLSGLNGAGKSSVIQALLVLRQLALWNAFATDQVSLAGDLVDLGPASEVLFSSAEEDYILIALKSGDNVIPASVVFEQATRTPHWGNLALTRDSITQFGSESTSLFANTALTGERRAAFNYLNAERYGPRKSLPLDERRGRIFDLGKHGEYVFDCLLHHQDNIIIDKSDQRYLPTGAGGRLREQIEAWLAEVSPGVRFEITGVPSADIAVGSFSFGREGALRSPEYRPTNVGFGLSYILPVLAALLAAPKGGIVLIENPEAHLHPMGQTKMGELCARAAAAGVQVIMETHSDHVLDGARMAIRDRILLREDAVFHYLRQENGQAIRITPDIDDQGRLSVWPDGFFDQHRKNAARLARPARG